MQTLEKEYDLELDPEELKQMSRLLAEGFIEQFIEQDTKVQLTLITCVSGYEVIKEDQIVEVVNLDLIASATAGALDPLGQLKEWFAGILNSIASFIISSLETFIETYVLPAISGVISSLQLFIETYVLPAFDNLQNFINTYVLPAISEVTELVSTHVLPAIGEVIPSISDFINTYVLPAINGVPPAITGFISVNVLPVISGVSDLISTHVLPAIGEVIPSISDFINTYVLPAIEGVSPTIMNFISVNVLPAISGVVSIIGETALAIFDLIGTRVLPAITGITPTITSFLNTYVTPILYNIASTISVGFHQLGTAIMGFVNAILRFPEWFPVWFETYISRPIVEGITRLPIIRPFGDPLGWVVDTLRPALESLAGVLWGALQGLGRMILDGLKAVAEWLMESIKGLAEFIGSLLISGFQALNDVFVEVGEPFGDFVRGIYESVIESTTSLMTSFTAKPFEGILKEFGMETPEILRIDYITKQWGLAHAYSFGIWLLPFLGQLPVRLTQWTMRAFARWVGDHEWVTRINLRPLGIGVDFQFNWAKAIASSLWHTSGELMKWLDEIPRGIIYGYAIWMTRPMTRLANFYLRDALPIELPREDTLIEFTRRMIPHEAFRDIWRLVRYYTALYGYSSMVTDQLFKLEKELYIEVTDRFGKKRQIPLSLMYQLPSASDVATMMVRDIFATLDDFQNLYKATGMMPDVGALYYFLRFRYPPPERLWQFTMRGVSGLLWATLPNAERDEIRKEAEPLGAFVEPVDFKAPIELNFQPETLFNAFKTYMKWHDMFRASWIKGFTSDNLIYIDTLADIPTKIEQRWMIKWGLYELLSGKNVKLDSPVSEFRTKIIENQPKSEVRMDLTLFARTVQATGLHPDWVPLTVVAEAINALADERTLLRTGFVNLFKEGFWNVDSLEKLLAGIIMASFQVSYFNIEEMEWGTGWVNQPVMFLPAERKLIELRALMDRALDILRETARDISRGYSEWIVETYEEYEDMLTEIINKINEFFSLDYQKITGLTLPEELKLKFVKEYYEPYVASLDIWRDIYTVRRVRYWTQRWLGWIMYRVATGVVEKADVEELITYVGEKAKLTPYEIEFIQGVLERLIGIAQREYAPTPMMLATICEIIPKARKFFDEVMKVRRVPEEWIPIWADYIDLRPIIGEVRRMLSRAEDLYVYFMVPEEDYRKVLDEIREFGYTDKEIELMLRSANYERQRRAWAELIGDVDRMVMLSEYSPKARDFALGTMQKMIDTLPINQPTKAVLKEMWEQYIRLKPVMDEVRRYVTELIAAFVEGIITEQEFSNELEALKEWGLDDYEITFYKTIAGMRKARKLAPRL